MYLFAENTWPYFAVLIAAAVLLYFIWLHWLRTYSPPVSALPLLAALAVPLGLVGGHVAYFLVNRLPSTAATQFFLSVAGWRSGYASIGTAAGILLAALVTALLRRIPMLLLLDQLAPLSFSLVIALRTGCLLNGCCYGVGCALPWAVRFPEIHNRSVFTAPGHPVQLYAIVVAAALYFLLPLLARRLQLRPGDGRMALLCLGFYAALRFGLGFLRNGATDAVFRYGMSVVQLTALALLFISLTLLLLPRRNT